VFRLIRINNPELFGEKRRYTIPPPIVQREGTKKTLFANIVDICNRMHRTPEHVIQFLFAELGTTGSVAGAGQLIIKGRFSQKQMENILRRYIGTFMLRANVE
jgi:translation initiation factor 2 subunit 2